MFIKTELKQALVRMNSVIHRIRKVPNGSTRHNRLGPSKGGNNNWEKLRNIQTSESYPEEFMGAFSGTEKAQFVITSEEERELFIVD